ncbi:ppsC [Symbiodinium sp. CCMP2456]|nr:ppsC [Symbiodinium sp. CCMP2456]
MEGFRDCIMYKLRRCQRPADADPSQKKFLYPSAGTTYSIQAHVSHEGRECFYDREGHALIRPQECAGTANSDVAVLTLYWRPRRLTELYEERGRRFAEIEAGAMLALIQQEAGALGLEASVSFASRPETAEEEEEPLLSISFVKKVPGIKRGLTLRDLQMHMFLYVLKPFGSKEVGLYKWRDGDFQREKWHWPEDMWKTQPAYAASIVYSASFLIICFSPSSRQAAVSAGVHMQRVQAASPAFRLGFCPLGNVELPCGFPVPEGCQFTLAMAGGALRDRADKMSWDEHIQQHLRSYIPIGWMPSVNLVKELPLTSSGKCDVSALMKKFRPVAQEGGQLGPELHRMATLWVEVLGEKAKGPVVAGCSFRDLGGDSQCLLKLVRKIKDAFGVQVRFLDLEANHGVKDMQAVVDKSRMTSPIAAMRSQSESFTASIAQHVMFATYEAEVCLPAHAYHIYLEVCLSGELQTCRLQHAVEELVKRHPMLAVRFHYDDSPPHELLLHPGTAAKMQVVDLRQEDDAEAAVRSRTADVIKKRFELKSGPLWRLCLFQLSNAKNVLIIVVHHIIADGESVGILLQDLATAYNREKLPPSPSWQYQQFAEQQRWSLSEEVAARKLEFWERYLAGMQPVNMDETARTTSGSEREASTATRRVNFKHTPEAATLLRSSFCLLLHSWFQQDDLLFGMTSSHRCDYGQDDSNEVGLYVNVLPFRSQVSAKTTANNFLGFVKESQQKTHQNRLPFRHLQDQLARNPNAPVHLSCNVLFILLESPAEDINFDGLQPVPLLAACGRDGACRFSDVPIAPMFDLTVRVDMLSEKCRLTYECKNSAHIQVERLASEHERLIFELAKVCQSGHDVPVKALCRHSQAQAHRSRLSELLSPVLHGNSRTRKGKKAVTSGSLVLTYENLMHRSSRVAAVLQKASARMVLLWLERSPELIVGLISCLSTGVPFVPLDVTSMPMTRASVIADDSGANVVLTTSQTLNCERFVRQLPPHVTPIFVNMVGKDQVAGVQWVKEPIDDDELAYIMYTSGSTGQPKGVEVLRRNLCSFLKAFAKLLPAFVSEKTIWYSVTRPSFDISLLEFLGCLLLHGELVLASEGARLNGQLMQKEIQSCGANVLQLTPLFWEQLPNLQVLATHNFLALCGGDSMSPTLAARFLEAGKNLHTMHVYGPTETTIWATAAWLQKGPERERCIGVPMQNASALVLSGPSDVRSAELQPATGEGELFLAGPCVARGYRNRPDLTSEKFGPCPFPDALDQQMYATGDVARWMNSDVTGSRELYFLGRRDSQIKIQGNRVELEEVELCLETHESVCRAVVVSDRLSLFAFIVLQGSTAWPEKQREKLRGHLEKHLESYKIPSRIFGRGSFPMTASGKVDKKQLLKEALGQTQAAMPISAAAGPDTDQQLVLQCLRRLLQRELGMEERLDIVTSFQAIELAARLKHELGQIIDPLWLLGAEKTCRSLLIELGRPTMQLMEPESVISTRIPSCGSSTEGVLVMGLAARAGKSGSCAQLWCNLLLGTDCMTDFSDDQLEGMSLAKADYESGDYVRVKGVVEDFACFDANFFQLGELQAQKLSPLHRCFLEEARMVIEDSGGKAALPSATAVFAGMGDSHMRTERRSSVCVQHNDPPEIFRYFVFRGDHDYLTGGYGSAEMLTFELANGKDFLASQVAYHFDLRGPAAGVQTLGE